MGQSAVGQSDPVLHSVDDGIARIVLNRPEQANAIGIESSRALGQAIDAVLAKKPRALLMTARGRIYCAGGNIGEFVAAGDRMAPVIDQILENLHPALARLHEAPVPTVAAINGPVGGAGVGLALFADFVLAAESMKLRTGYSAIGLSPDAGTSFFLAQRIGPVRARQWLMTSDPKDGRQCLEAGAVDAVYPDAELQPQAEALVRRLASMATASLGGIKTLCNRAGRGGFEEHLRLERQMLVARAAEPNAIEGVRAFVEKRAPKFRGL